MNLVKIDHFRFGLVFIIKKLRKLNLFFKYSNELTININKNLFSYNIQEYF